MKRNRRVVITGAGTINPIGASVRATMQSMASGTCGIGPLDLPDIGRLRIKIGAQVKGYAPHENFSDAALLQLDRAVQFTLIAAHEAIAQSGIVFSKDLASNTGVILGTAGGGLETQEANYRAVFQDGRNRVHPLVVPKLMHNAGAAQVSMEWGLTGPSYSVSSACASSNHAMGQAFHLIRSGALEAAVTGGADAMLTFGGVKAWEGLRVLSPDGCRPFCADRNGMVLGEGAAVFVFETLEHARARGATPLAEVVGFAMTSDAFDLVSPSQDGAANAMQRALADGNVRAAQVDYINAHGTGTVANDRTESAAIHDVFEKHAAQLLVSSTKSMHGHLIGGTGAVELIAVLLALTDGVVAPTIGGAPDTCLGLDVVAKVARAAHPEVAMSNAFAFGGANAVLVLRRA
ncbi:MAG: beta-ketoacyl-[acyl-carrier-protein] synthase family protein [Pseudomonadota bacterium]